MPLFNRRAVLQVAGLDLSELRLAFDVTKDLRGRPNKAAITVYNLSPDTRRLISDAKDRRVVLLAGYETEQPHAIFVGALSRAEHKREGASWVTKISGDDGISRVSRVSASFGRGSAVDRVLKDVVSQITKSGIGPGNTNRVAATLKNRAIGSAGLAVSGSADVALDGLLESLGLEWSVQDLQLQILERGKPRQTRAVVVSPDTGLVGVPEALEKQRVRAKSLLSPGLDPGLVIRLESRDLQGFYRVDSARYAGDTESQPWYATLELRPVE
jgi:hypothetical protein